MFNFLLFLPALLRDDIRFTNLMLHIGLLTVCVLVFQLVFRTYNTLWRYAESREYLALLLSAFLGFFTYEVISRLFINSVISFLLLTSIASLWVLGMLLVRFTYRVYRSHVLYRQGSHQIPIAIVGAGAAGAQLLVVHHGISWGGGIRRIEGGVYRVVKAAMDADLAVYACHLPLDAHPKLGNNAQLAKALRLSAAKPAFVYHGETIGLVGRATRATAAALAEVASGDLVGVCSGGAGEFAEEAQRLGCRVYVTGEANWGEVVVAANCGMRMICLGHYETEVWGVRAVAKAMASALGVRTVDLTEVLK